MQGIEDGRQSDRCTEDHAGNRAAPLGIAALTTWINITIRFAPDAAQAKREARLIFFKVTGWIALAVVVVQMAQQIISPNLSLRASLLVIILDSFVLFNAYMLWVLRRHLQLIDKLNEMFGHLTEVVGHLVDAQEQPASSN
jgi:hypothetical protein